jgi:hypothetical protein
MTDDAGIRFRGRVRLWDATNQQAALTAAGAAVGDDVDVAIARA